VVAQADSDLEIETAFPCRKLNPAQTLQVAKVNNKGAELFSNEGFTFSPHCGENF